MNEGPSQPNIDESGRMRLTEVRATLDAALAQFEHEPQLRRAFIHSIGAIDDRLGRVRGVPPNRPTRRRPG